MPVPSDEEFDVVVIGAGPAGSVSALLAARVGARTLLIERKRLPRDKTCGGCLNAAGIGALRTLGLEDAVDGLPLDELQIGRNHRRVRLRLPGAIAIARREFDGCLVEHAVRDGVQLRTETCAQVGPLAQSHRLVDLTDASGTRRIRARLVIVAGGLTGSAIRHIGPFVTSVARSSRIGASCVVPDWPSAYGGRTITMVVGRRGYVGLGQTRAGLDVAFAADPEAVRRAGGPAGLAAGILAEAGFPAVPGLHQVEWTGTVPLTRTTRPVGADRVFLVGDAAGYVEPFTGQGMTLALQGALALAPLVEQGLQDWSPAVASAWCQTYRYQIARRAWPAALVARTVRRPWLASAAMALAGVIPSAPDLLIRAVNRSHSANGLALSQH